MTKMVKNLNAMQSRSLKLVVAKSFLGKIAKLSCRRSFWVPFLKIPDKVGPVKQCITIKLCMEVNFGRIKLCEKNSSVNIRFKSFFNGFLGQKTFRDLREKGPWLSLNIVTLRYSPKKLGVHPFHRFRYLSFHSRPCLRSIERHTINACSDKLYLRCCAIPRDYQLISWLSAYSQL